MERLDGIRALRHEETMGDQVRDDHARNRFELDVSGQVVFADYRREAGTILIFHVEAPPNLRGTGAAGRLMQGIVDIARHEGKDLAPLCSYASAWLRRHAGRTPGPR
jgi:uncharacterized protein